MTQRIQNENNSHSPQLLLFCPTGYRQGFQSTTLC